MMQNIFTKRLIITSIIALLLAPSLAVSGLSVSQTPGIKVEKITSKITRFEETIQLSYSQNLPVPEGAFYRVSVYGVKIGNGVVLIDAGDDSLAEELYQAVTQTLHKPIIAVYLTHYHADHAGAGAFFQELGIPVYAPMGDAMFIMAGANLQPGIPDEFTYAGYTPEKYYETDALEPGFSWMPEIGHTAGAISIQYDKDDKSYLFSADTILPMFTDNTNQLDLTYDLTVGTAYQNYGLTMMGYGTFWYDQLDTLYGMLGSVGGYDLVLTGHTPVLDSTQVINYIGYTIATLEYFPYI